ncbi:MAG: hypothetical protein II158_02830 [Bacilli bacterium]|nr:hypothetical protein [Bacilli bacterium]
MKRKFALLALLALTLLSSCGGKKTSGNNNCDGNVCRIGTAVLIQR